MGSPLKASRTPALPLTDILQTDFVRDCTQWFTRERLWINDVHAQVCRVPAPTFLEQKRAEWMIEKLRSLGWQTKLDRAGNVIAHLAAAPQPPYVVLTAHLDTVLAPKKPEDIICDPDGRLRGAGVSDNGTGLAALLAIAHAAKTFDPTGKDHASLVLVANVGEEGEGNLSGMRFLCRQSPIGEKASAFVVLDGPTTDHITCTALASRRFEVTFSGNGGHSWSDFGTGNPIHALSRAIAWFTENCPGCTPTDIPRASFNFGLVDGGSSINSIPTSARAKVDLRSENPSRLDQMADLLKTSVEQALQAENAHATSRVNAKVKEIGSRPGGGLPADAPLLQLVRAVDSHLGIRSHLDCASTDANVPLSMEIPAVSIGAGGQGGGAHTPSEWFHPEGRDLGLRRILLILESLLKR
jgi:acetylornithine deacetylase/succinyl-diaminopimelate desuccinylase-like protein